MKFQKKYTEQLRQALKYIFSISILLISTVIFLPLLLQRIQTCTYISERITRCEVLGINTDVILGIPAILMALSIVILLITYLVYILVGGFEKPKFINAKEQST